MKRILFILSVFILGSFIKAQTVTVFAETFSTSTVPGFDPAKWGTPTTGWATEDGQVLPPCDAVNSNSANSNYLMGTDGAPGTFHIKTISVATIGNDNLEVTWNEFKLNSGSPVAVTFSFSVNNGSTWIQVPFTDLSSPNLDAWFNMGVITIPSQADNQTAVLFRWSYSGTGTGNVLGIDDIHIWGSNSSSTYYYDGTGDVNLKQNWNTMPNGSGTNCNGFDVPGRTFKLIQAANISLNGDLIVSGAGTVFEIGDGATYNVNLNTGGFNFMVQNPALLRIYNNSTLTVNQTTAVITGVAQSDFQTGSTVDYASASSGNIMPANHYNLTISGGGTKTMIESTGVSNSLNLTNGNIALASTPSYVFTLNGNLTGSGLINANGMRLAIGGSGNLNLNTSTGTIGALTLNRAGVVTLNNNITFNGNSAITTGTLDFAGKSLTLSSTGAIAFGGGVFSASNTSTLTFGNGLGTTTGSMLFSQASSSSRSLFNLTFNKASSTTLNIGNALDIYGTLLPTKGIIGSAGNITIKSSAASKGRIGVVGASGSISGNVRVETFIPGGTTDWAVLGVSGVNGQTMNSWYGAIPMAIEGSATGVTSAGGNYFESVQGWNESNAYGYDTTITIGTALTPGKGFWVYTGTGLSSTSDIITTVNGSAVTGNVNIGLTSSAQSGFNLIANPYASPISWAALRNGNAAVDNAIYIYNADLGLTTSYVNGVSTPASSSANDVIPMGQGFYVQATSGTNLTAQESNKVSSNNGLLKSANSSSLYGDVMRLNVMGGGYADDAAIRLHSSATSGFDTEWDARKLYTSPGYVGYPGVWTKRTVIATQSNNEDFSINSLPHPTTQHLVIPVIVRVYTSGQYTISGSDLENIDPNSCVVLKDKVTNIIHDLRTGDYVCNINDTTYAARFELTICALGSTPTSIKSVAKPLNNSMYVSKDSKGIFTALNFDKPTNATISVTNILGQKIIDSKKVNVTKETVYLDINTTEQLIFVTVETENEKVTKKFLNYN